MKTPRVRGKKILVAFDKFKDCMTSEQALQIASDIIENECSNCEIVGLPLTDGGEGFVQALMRTAGGDIVSVPALSATERSIDAHIGLVPIEQLPASVRPMLQCESRTMLGVVEMAQASGLEMLSSEERNVWRTSTEGCGQMLLAAAELGADCLLMGIGGSATHDLGLGALRALGLELLDDAGLPLRAIPFYWSRLAQMEASNLRSMPPLQIACDVGNPLLGAQGAAFSFAQQKGANPADLPRLEALTERVSSMLCQTFNKPLGIRDEPRMGAAGGMGFGMTIALDARIISGGALVSSWLGLEPAIANADLILTGEGRFDATSMHGKGPVHVLDFASRHEKEVWLFAGALDESAVRSARSQNPLLKTFPITPENTPPHLALLQGPEALAKALREALRSSTL
ncbi:MAG: glycerate kinase [Myxococcales bacterium]|nr:glycerate kinase [Myxococcales bacterium]